MNYLVTWVEPVGAEWSESVSKRAVVASEVEARALGRRVIEALGPCGFDSEVSFAPTVETCD